MPASKSAPTSRRKAPATAAPAADPAPAKRPVGRPRKITQAAPEIAQTLKRAGGRPRKTPAAPETAPQVRYEISELPAQGAAGRLGVMRVKPDGVRELVSRYHTHETAEWIRQIMTRGAV